MDKIYTSKDMIEMAVQAKARGVELYMFLARNSGNYHVGQLFAELAKDEERHKLQLNKALSSLSGSQREEAYPGERALYLKALVDANTFNCGQTCMKSLETTISEEEALKAGINFEKDFMLFLHELRLHAAGTESEKTVDALLGDEVKHLSEMFKLKDKLEKGK
jgi:rubrerythrin